MNESDSGEHIRHDMSTRSGTNPNVRNLSSRAKNRLSDLVHTGVQDALAALNDCYGTFVWG